MNFWIKVVILLLVCQFLTNLILQKLCGFVWNILISLMVRYQHKSHFVGLYSIFCTLFLCFYELVICDEINLKCLLILFKLVIYLNLFGEINKYSS